MKAVIMAGGKGTRMATVNADMPKPMLPLCGKPILEREIACLVGEGITEIILVVGHLGHVIKDYFGDGARFGAHITYFTEETPLGTAGAVKAAVLPAGHSTDQFGDRLAEDGNILVLSGDALFEGDLTRLIRAHEQSRADVTIAAKEIEDVTGYGVMVGSPSQITAFVEKPNPESTPSHTVNIGIYLLSRRVLSEIPNGVYDFGKDLFPALLKKGYRLAYTLFEDDWCDIGTHQSYLDANLKENNGKNVMGAKCTVLKDTKIESSLLLDEVSVGENCRISNAILANKVTIGDGVTLFHNVVGDGCTLTQTPPPHTAISWQNGTLSVTPLPEAKPLLTKT